VTLPVIFHRGVAEIAERHRTLGDVRGRRGRVLDQIRGRKRDALVERELAALDARQQRGDEHDLERGAHREALVAPPSDARAAPRVDGEDAQAPADLSLELRELLLHVFVKGCIRPGSRARRREARERSERERASPKGRHRSEA
jgi:hypothetical protein